MIKVLGHRGARQHKGLEENSLPAFALAMKTADGVETDVVVSADKVPFLTHETRQFHIPHLFTKTVSNLRLHLSRASARAMKGKWLREISAEEADKLRLRDGEKVPRLAELFNLASEYPGATLNIELKTAAAVEPALEEIGKAVAAGRIRAGQIIVTSFDHAAVARVRALAPALRTGLLFSHSDFDGRRRALLNDKARRQATLSEENLGGAAARAAAPDYFVMTADTVSAEGVERIHARFPKAKIMLWTTRAPDRDTLLHKKLADPGIAPHIEAIISDFPGEMVDMLRKKGLRP